jgi:hypothetical protein
MKIEHQEITVRELTAGYIDSDEEGVRGYSGKLDIRPPYQREFIYKDKQRDAVINTIKKGLPLNTMYWSVREDGDFEVIDGQQRTISFCQYVAGDFSFEDLAFHNLPTDLQDQIYDYKLTVYLCSGTDSERLDWFRTINIAGEKLTDQELRNAVYAGPWVTDAKKHFSKTECAAYGLGSDYMSGSPIRQDYLETVIKCINDGEIEAYMAKNQHKPDANPLWLYFQAVIAWVKATFPQTRSEMKSVPWGDLYNAHKDDALDAAKLEKEVSRLMADEDVTKKSGIYPFLLNGKEKSLNIRAFSPNQRREAYERQKGVCSTCGEHFEIEEMHADHIKAWNKGGKTEAANCRMLCSADNLAKGG